MKNIWTCVFLKPWPKPLITKSCYFHSCAVWFWRKAWSSGCCSMQRVHSYLQTRASIHILFLGIGINSWSLGLPSLGLCPALWRNVTQSIRCQNESHYSRCLQSLCEALFRVILLHGPPGSGKTSLCKALAQKLSIRFSHRCTVYFILFPETFSYIFLFCADVVCESFPTKTTFLIVTTHVRYAQTQLVEVDAHSLFSKWFSESGKLVRSWPIFLFWNMIGMKVD